MAEEYTYIPAAAEQSDLGNDDKAVKEEENSSSFVQIEKQEEEEEESPLEQETAKLVYPCE